MLLVLGVYRGCHILNTNEGNSRSAILGVRVLSLEWVIFCWTRPVIPFLEVLDCSLARLFDFAIRIPALTQLGVPHQSSLCRGLPPSRKPRYFVSVIAEVHALAIVLAGEGVEVGRMIR